VVYIYQNNPPSLGRGKGMIIDDGGEGALKIGHQKAA